MPYKLSPSRIFCLHWVVGASWRTQSLIQGRGELGPGLSKNTRKTKERRKEKIHKPGQRLHCHNQNYVHLHLLALTWHHWSSRMSWGWIHRRPGPAVQTHPCQTYLAAPYWPRWKRKKKSKVSINSFKYLCILKVNHFHSPCDSRWNNKNAVQSFSLQRLTYVFHQMHQLPGWRRLHMFDLFYFLLESP